MNPKLEPTMGGGFHRSSMHTKDLMGAYTSKELRQLLSTPVYAKSRVTHSANKKFKAAYDAIMLVAKSLNPQRRHRWTEEEDRFLQQSYMFLTDNTLALALNIPVNMVLARRRVKGFIKTTSTSLEVIVWCNRSDYEKDLKEEILTKARPDITW